MILIILILVLTILILYFYSKNTNEKLKVEENRTVFLKEELKEKFRNEVKKPMIDWDHELISNNFVERKRICLTLLIQSLRVIEMNNSWLTQFILNLIETKKNLDEANFVLLIIKLSSDIANQDQKSFLEKNFKNEPSSLYFIQCINVILYSNDMEKGLLDIENIANKSCSSPIDWKLPYL